MNSIQQIDFFFLNFSKMSSGDLRNEPLKSLRSAHRGVGEVQQRVLVEPRAVLRADRASLERAQGGAAARHIENLEIV